MKLIKNITMDINFDSDKLLTEISLVHKELNLLEKELIKLDELAKPKESLLKIMHSLNCKTVEDAVTRINKLKYYEEKFNDILMRLSCENWAEAVDAISECSEF